MAVVVVALIAVGAVVVVAVTITRRNDRRDREARTSLSTPGDDATSPSSIAPTEPNTTERSTVPAAAVTSTTIGTPPPVVDGKFPCPALDGSAERVVAFPAAPPSCLDAGAHYAARVTTSVGSYTIALDATAAPIAVNNFVYLARYHYFDQTPCHRVVPDFVVQCGDPTGTGMGGPGYSFADELPKAGDYRIGSVAMANSGENTNGSQFFVISGEQGVALPPLYSLFGQVTDGLDTIAATDFLGVGDGPPSSPVTIVSVTITETQ